MLAEPDGRFSYDAFGKRRHDHGQSDPSNSLRNRTTDYGYTTQEHLDEVGLVHLNGRVYDPSLGRFISADPTVQYPESTQGLNRYSYVQNNPLSYTDPSGFFIGALVKAIHNVVRAIRKNFRTIVAIGVSIAIANPYLAGFVSGVISGGDLKSGIIGALTAGAFNYVGGLKLNPAERIFAHGAIGGTSSVLQGGSFKSGFLSSGLSQIATPYANKISAKFGDIAGTAAAAISGGIGSILGGGKFANGAITGSFGYLFNELKHRLEIIVSDPRFLSFGSQFGHVAMIIDGIVYSRSPTKILVGDAKEYIETQETYRDSYGYVLDVSASEVITVKNYYVGLVQANRGYGVYSNNCSCTIADALGKINIEVRGAYQFGTVSPADIMINLPKSGRVIEENFYGKNKR